MTTGAFRYIDPSSYTSRTGEHVKPWGKVDGPGTSYRLVSRSRPVTNIRGRESEFSTDISGFAVYKSPLSRTFDFDNDADVREGYYADIQALLKEKLEGIKKVVIFDHTIRKRDKDAPRQPVQQVHVDQTAGAAEARVRRHLPENEVEELLSRRYQIINVWRPISHPATDFPLAVIDWRTTSPEDFIAVDLLYPKRTPLSETSGNASHDDDDRGKEVVPDPSAWESTENYEVRGETFAVRPNDSHEFWYMKDMTPDEAMFIKCFDSIGQGLPKGKDGLARCTPHTAFEDPATPEDAKGRQSIEVRCLIFYE
ncbi:hypothetical protein QTJ16_003564 [Diplocarpon rosae]|uniref:Methyltransferase n=1 Tax=Diplocarpon rosae TaxID=946125 RepID=A0AAD9T2G5_9HELO|nr:hypothetical protein QTJ16_003564 [Diplocarpon rosae]